MHIAPVQCLVTQIHFMFVQSFFFLFEKIYTHTQVGIVLETSHIEESVDMRSTTGISPNGQVFPK